MHFHTAGATGDVGVGCVDDPVARSLSLFSRALSWRWPAQRVLVAGQRMGLRVSLKRLMMALLSASRNSIWQSMPDRQGRRAKPDVIEVLFRRARIDAEGNLGIGTGP